MEDDIKNHPRLMKSLDETLHNDQMGRTAHREKFRQPLNDSQYDAFPDTQMISFPAIMKYFTLDFHMFHSSRG